jgi:hypothetical protein
LQAYSNPVLQQAKPLFFLLASERSKLAKPFFSLLASNSLFGFHFSLLPSFKTALFPFGFSFFCTKHGNNLQQWRTVS